MIKLNLLLMLLGSALLFAGNNWTDIRQTAHNKMVEIEYYEKLNSSDDLKSSTKRKHYISGILVDDKGLILTSNAIFKARLDFTGSSHFAPPDPPSDIRARFQDGSWENAGFVGKDDEKGIAFIRLKNKPKSKGIHFTNDSLTLGANIVIVRMLKGQYANRFLIQNRVVNSTLKHNRYLTELNNNGTYALGLVFNLAGRPVGITKPSGSRAHFDGNFFSTGNGLAEIAPIASFSEMIKSPPVFTRKKAGNKKWFGVNMQPLTKKMARYFGIADSAGILINTVLKNSPAQKAGLIPGDILLRFDRHKVQAQKVSDLESFRNLVRDFDKPVASVLFWRAGKAYRTQVRLTEIPISQFLAKEVSDYWLGFGAKELTKDIILDQKLDFGMTGLWVSRVERAGLADLAGLRVGDILLKINGREISDPDQLKKETERLKKQNADFVSLFVRQGPETRFIFINTRPEVSAAVNKIK